MCDVAPFGMECQNEEYKHQLMCCQVNHLSLHLQELRFSIPLIGKIFEECENKVECVYFEPKQKEEM